MVITGCQELKLTCWPLAGRHHTFCVVHRFADFKTHIGYFFLSRPCYLSVCKRMRTRLPAEAATAEVWSFICLWVWRLCEMSNQTHRQWTPRATPLGGRSTVHSGDKSKERVCDRLSFTTDRQWRGSSFWNKHSETLTNSIQFNSILFNYKCHIIIEILSGHFS